MTIITIILVGTLTVVLILSVASFNSLTASLQDIKESWSDIDVQLKRRHELIPNLIDTVKQYSDHESSVFQQIVELRTKAISLNQDDIPQKAKVENDLASCIHSLLAIKENYPELKSNENFLKLQEAMTKTEDEIASARRIYNDNVANYNTKVRIFPSIIIAKICHFVPASFFQNN